MLNLKDIDKSWTLFLDRDGVINHEKYEAYILNYGEFIFYDGVLEAMKTFNDVFGHIILVTNQRGVAKGLMNESDLMDIHNRMLKEVEAAGGRLDAIYYCTSLDNDHSHRKPQCGMAHDAQEDYPEIDFSKSIMVGNKMSDMKFGRNAGMHTIYMQTTNPEQALPDPAIDLAYNNLLNFAKAIVTK